MDGEGIFQSPDGRKYEGSFVKGFKNGPGQESGNDYLYTGNFLNGKYHGYGTLIYKDGRKYEGYFSSGKMSGRGTFTWKDGRKF